MESHLFLIILSLSIIKLNAFINIEINNPNPAIDHELYEQVLDVEECKQQIEVIQQNMLLWLQCKSCT